MNYQLIEMSPNGSADDMQNIIMYSNGVVMPPTNQHFTTGSHVHWNHKCPERESNYIDPCIFVILFAQLVILYVSLLTLKNCNKR